jgi:chromosome segregation ATPase
MSEQESQQKKSNPEEVKNQEITVEQTEVSENTASVLSPENKSFFRRMSEGGVKIANQVYEGLYKIPGVNRVIGKIEIAYNQFWIDRHQEKITNLKEKIDSLDLRINALDQSKKEIESVIENLKQQNVPGVESLQIKLQDIDRQKAALLNEKDKVQSKFEAMDNKLKLYTNERDRVADKLIGRYEEKLNPLEAELERLQTFRDQVDSMVASTEERHKELLAHLAEIEKKKTQIEDALRRTGMSEKKIRKFEAIKKLEEYLLEVQEKMRLEKENLAWRKVEINRRIAEVDAKANPYRDKREEFVRVKEGRPIKIDLEKRKRGKGFMGMEEAKAHSRSEVLRDTGPVSDSAENENGDEQKRVNNGVRKKQIGF